MADLPILFSGSMVRAIMREIANPGTGKTQTRRIFPNSENMLDYVRTETGGWKFAYPEDAKEPFAKPPRIKVGDRLYVREAWRVAQKWDGHSPVSSKKGNPILPARGMTVFFDAGGSIANQASGKWEPDNSTAGFPDWIGKNRQGMHMPKWASRLTLIVEGVKVERLKDCSEADAIAEGVERHYSGWMPYSTSFFEVDGFTPANYHPDPRDSYHQLWDKINGFGAWDKNPWVIAYTFRPILGNIDQVGGAS